MSMQDRQLHLPKCLLVTLVLIICWQWESTAAEPGDALKRVEATDSFRAIAHFPKDIRESILVLSQHPKLIKALAAADDRSPDSMEAIVKSYPDEIRQAAVRLAKFPQALDVIANNLEATTLLGIIYSHHADELNGSADRIHEELLAEDSKTLTDWSALLERDGRALDELVEAADDFAIETNFWIDPSSDQSLEEQFGFYIGPAFEPVFYALPAYRPVIYVLRNADRYPQLANVIITLRQSNRVHAPLYDAVDDWWRIQSNYYSNIVLRNDARRPSRLREMAQFEKRYAETTKSQAGTVSRDAFRRRYSDDFQRLSPFALSDKDRVRDQDRDRDHVSDRSPNQASSRDRQQNAVSERDQRLAQARALIQQRAAAERTQRKARIDAGRQLTSNQRAARATQNLGRVWGANNRSSQSRGGGAGRGGAGRQR